MTSERIEAASGSRLRDTRPGLTSPTTGDPALTGESGRSGVRLVKDARDGDAGLDRSVPGEVPSAGVEVDEPPKKEAKGLILPSLPPAVFVPSLLSDEYTAEDPLLSGGKGRGDVSVDREKVGKWEDEDVRVIGRSIDIADVLVAGSRMADKKDESGENVESMDKVDLIDECLVSRTWLITHPFNEPTIPDIVTRTEAEDEAVPLLIELVSSF